LEPSNVYVVQFEDGNAITVYGSGEKSPRIGDVVELVYKGNHENFEILDVKVKSFRHDEMVILIARRFNQTHEHNAGR
jgi:hypothetical protein